MRTSLSNYDARIVVAYRNVGGLVIHASFNSQMLKAALKTLFPLVALGALSGCGNQDKKVIGKWKVDVSTFKVPGNGSFSSKLTGQMKQGMSQLVFQFNADGTATVQSPGGAAAPAKWTLEGDKVVVTPAGGGSVQSPGQFTVNSDGTKMHLTSGNPGSEMQVDLVRTN